ncbi:unnamed protein product, partial [Effrenium voratum]
DGAAFAAHPRCREQRIAAAVGDCQVLSGGFMSAAQAAADDTSRAPDCVVEFHMEPPFTVRFGAFPPKDDTSRLYSKVHSIGPDGHHRAVLLGLPSNCAHDTVGAELRAPQGMREQLPFKCSLFRRTIERGRLFGGGSKAVEEALAAILDSREPTAAAAALRCLLMVMLDAVRLWLPRPEHLSFSSLAMFAVLAAAIPWRPPAAFRAQLLRTALAAQAADQPRSYMRWQTWRQPTTSDDGRLELASGEAELRDALRLLSRGFLCLAASEADMVARYADVMVNRGGLPLYQLPVAQPEVEETLPSDYQVAAVDCSVLPLLPLHLQAVLAKPPLCQSTNLKDLHLRNLRFFVDQTQFNIRHQKDLKLRGGFIEAGDMERIVNYMDEEHFAAGRDLAEARALPEDAELGPCNGSPPFEGEEECQLQSQRCLGLRSSLRRLQRHFLRDDTGAHGPKRPNRRSAARVVQKSMDMALDEGLNDQCARLDAFLSCFGATVEVKTRDMTLRVTCARVQEPDRPLLIQRASKSSSPGDRDEAFQEVFDQPTREAATEQYCKLFTKECGLPTPPQGFVWHSAGALRATAKGERLRFFVGSKELPAFDAGPILQKCRVPAQLCSLGADRELLLGALYLTDGDQVELLQQLRGCADHLRQGESFAAPDWLEDAMESSIPVCIWQEVYARLILEEDYDGHPCLTIASSHPYAGTIYRVVLLLAFLYPCVLAPARSELAYRITRSSQATGSLHRHLVAAMKTLAFRDVQQPETSPEAKVVTPLFPYQTEAVQRLLLARHAGASGSLDASSLGAGKTLVALSFCLHLAGDKGGQFLVLCASSSLMDGWRQQLAQHMQGVHVQMQQENGMLRDVLLRDSSETRRKRKKDGEVLFVLTTYSRAARHPFSCTWLLVVADECLALQNTDTLQCAAAWRLVSRSLYGGHFISGTMFRRHYSDLLDMLKMLQSSIPLRAEFVQAYFGAYLISYVRPQRPWSTELIPLDIPPSVQAGYLEVLDECRGRGAQNFVKVLGRMRRLLSTSLQQDPRPLAEAVWSAVRQLRAQGRRPLVFASTEREAEALARLIACARRFRKSHPAHCKGCDLCRNFNKFAPPGCEKMPPIEGSESEQELLIFTVGADSAGLNLQSLGDALVLRPVQMDQLVQMMGRLDRPGQSSDKLCRAILYMKRTHEEAEVAHLQKHAAFWSLHIKPVARLIVLATAAAGEQDVGERYEQLLKGEQSELKATPEEVQQLAAARHESVWPHSFPFGWRSWGSLPASTKRARLGDGLRRVFQQVQSCTEAVIDLEMPAQLPVLPKAMTRQSVQMGVGYLIQNDERFRHVVQLIGPPTGILELLGKGRPDPFTTLVQTVCHQQLSVKVCQAMFQRLLGLCGNRDTKVLHPQRVLAESADKIREVAKLSYRKIEYIQKIAERFQDGTFDSEVFEQASDDELRSRLTQLPGIGEWTLEMFLIFQLHRHGGIPYGDVAIQSAMKMIYNIAPPADVTAKNEV